MLFRNLSLNKLDYRTLAWTSVMSNVRLHRPEALIQIGHNYVGQLSDSKEKHPDQESVGSLVTLAKSLTHCPKPKMVTMMRKTVSLEFSEIQGRKYFLKTKSNGLNFPKCLV